MTAQDESFLRRAERAFDSLFADAREKSEIDFVLALNPEFRGVQAVGWSSAEEVLRAIEDFSTFLNNGSIPIRLRIRSALGFYCNLCEASGLYEVPKNLIANIGWTEASLLAVSGSSPAAHPDRRGDFA
jgi:hypothetical protein